MGEKRQICHNGNDLGPAEFITSFLGKARGLMFRLKPKTLIFANGKDEKVSLHMWFVFFPIDVVYLDENKKVVELVEHFYPFMVHAAQNKSRFIVEFPKGSIKKHNLKLGSQLQF